ncbi:hypothetical protein J8164_001000 [Campylobacter lari]|nr:hypothetical protein [Campylobacter lari]
MDINKILVIGYTSDNLSSFLSFFRELKLEKTKNEDKIVQMLNTISSFKKNTYQINSCKIQKIYYPLLQDFDKESKEKKCYIANPNLLYVAEDWAQLDQNILFILVYENPIEILKQKIYSNDRLSMEDALNFWLEYNIFLLDFYKRNKERCILVNYQNFDILLYEYLKEKYYFDIVKTFYKNNSVENKNLLDFILEYMINSFNQCVDSCYRSLEIFSLNPLCQDHLSFQNLEKEIINLFQILKISELLNNKNKTFLDFIFEIQEYIEKLYHENIDLKKDNFQDNLTQIRLLNDQLSFCAKYGTAKSRIKNQLSYKLGQAMIINSKTFLGYLIMPIVLLSIVVSHKQEQKIYKQKIKKDSSLILPPLEQYPDYKESIELKNHFSYKLGQALIASFKNPLKLWMLPYKIFICVKIHKRG